MLYLSQNDYPRFLFRKVACATFQEIETVCSFTQVLRKVLASCTTSVYVNLSKNSFFLFACQVVFLICGCKGTVFFWATKTFLEKFSFLGCFLCTSWFRSITKTATHYYILYKGESTILLREDHAPVARGLHSLHGRIGKNTLICNKTMAVYKKIRTFALSIREKWIVIIE